MLTGEGLLFTPCPVTRFAMHRIYAIRINSRGISRDFGILMPKCELPVIFPPKEKRAK